MHQLFGFLFFVIANIIHIFRQNVKFDIALGDISTRNLSLSHGALKIIDWEGSYSLGEKDAGSSSHPQQIFEASHE